jgi:transcriptional regulator with XRE-family HTH domain
MRKSNFDRYINSQMQDPSFAERFRLAGEAWEIALQISMLRERAGMTQKELATRLKTSQQQISRLESPGYEGHSLSMLRRVARALGADVHVILEPLAERRKEGGTSSRSRKLVASRAKQWHRARPCTHFGHR